MDSGLSDELWTEVASPTWAWRAHRIVLRKGSLLLAPAVSTGPIWYPAEVQHFSCRKGCRRPLPTCSCGLYAKPRPVFDELADLHSARGGSLIHGTPGAIALVRLDGTVLGRDGVLRAEAATPLRFMPVCCLCMKDGRQGAAVAAIGCGHEGTSHVTPLCRDHLESVRERERRPLL